MAKKSLGVEVNEIWNENMGGQMSERGKKYRRTKPGYLSAPAPSKKRGGHGRERLRGVGLLAEAKVLKGKQTNLLKFGSRGAKKSGRLVNTLCEGTKEGVG